MTLSKYLSKTGWGNCNHCTLSQSNAYFSNKMHIQLKHKEIKKCNQYADCKKLNKEGDNHGTNKIYKHR